MNRSVQLVDLVLPDSIEWLLSGVNVAVFSSVIVDEERIVFDNEGEIYSDSECNIQLGRWLFTIERPLLGA